MEPLTSRYRAARAQNGSLLTNYARAGQHRDRYWLHILLFLLTLASTVLAGGQLVGRLLAYDETRTWFVLMELPITTGLVLDGLRYGLSLLLFLTVHEFGHYFAARFHRVNTSLPYYIPMPLLGFGTLGAVIRIRDPIPNMRKLFDIGAAGPIAGFVVALGLILYALATLPPPSYIFDMPGHEALKAHIQQYGTFPESMPREGGGDQTMVIVIGQTLLYWILTQFFPNVPPMYEMYHYPVLFAGWLGLFFTALNLLPVGQLDGGHILYALVGRKWHARLAHGFVLVLLLSGSIGFVGEAVPWFAAQGTFMGAAAWLVLAAVLFFYLSRIFGATNLRLIAPVLVGIVALTALAHVIGPAATQFGYSGWFVFCLLIVFLIKVDHPPVLYAEPLTPVRRGLAILCILIFMLCFSIRPIYIL